NQTQLGVKAAFDLTWEKLDIQSQQLAAFLSLFSPQLIVWELVVYCLKQRLFTGDHPNVATSLNNLPFLYDSLKYTAAEPLYIQALEMRQRLFTGDHPDVATSLNNLAGLYNSQGKYTAAEPLYIQALEMCERVLGVNHPNTVTVRENLRLLRQQQQPASLSVFQRLLVVLILPFYLFWLLIKPIVKFFWRWLRR
ncbi:MAG: tetratricopeptide repeat protein, partial [Dolichospermum sp.]